MSDTKVYVKEVGPDTINFQEVDKETLGTKVVANPELTGDEAKLTGLQVGDSKYSVGDVGEITIEQTQLLSTTEIQLTEAQANILKEFNFVHIKIPFASLEQVVIKVGQNNQFAVFITPAQVNADNQTFYTQSVIDFTTNIVTQTERYSSAVIANTSGGTQQLNSLRVGDLVYNIPNELPTITSADGGKVLTASANGEVSWQTPASVGGGLSPRTVTVYNQSNATIYVYTIKGLLVLSPSQSATANIIAIIGIKVTSSNVIIQDNRSYITGVHLNDTAQVYYFGVGDDVTQITLTSTSGGGGGTD